MTPRPLYKLIAGSIDALQRCQKNGNQFGIDIHEDALEQFEKLLPSGSGIDSGTKIDMERSKADKLVLTFGFHHMNDTGMYDGWTEHTLTITPSLCFDFDMRISGRDKNQIKDYLYETYRYALSDLIDYEQGNSDKGDKREGYYFSVSMREGARQYQQSQAV